MQANQKLAEEMNFRDIYFHTMDIAEFSIAKKVDIVYSLHACDTATDKTMYLGIKNKVKIILSVSCCQHSISIQPQLLKSMVRYKSFRDKLLMFVADSLRALLLERHNYKVDIFDFVSSRYTEKNTMVRGPSKPNSGSRLTNGKNTGKLSRVFNAKPYLEKLLEEEACH